MRLNNFRVHVKTNRLKVYNLDKVTVQKLSIFVELFFAFQRVIPVMVLLTEQR